MKTSPRRLALVLNDRAGALLGTDGNTEKLAASLRADDFDVVEIPPGPLPGRIEQARDSGAGLVVVSGGDGTIACAAQALAGSNTILGIIPAGTANLLAHDLGIPAGDPAAAIRILRHGQSHAIDVGTIDDQVFLCAVMFGSPARLGHHRETGRKRGNGLAGWLHFARAFVRATQRHRAVSFRATVDGTPHRVRTPSLTITVNQLDDATGRLFGRLCLDGGTLTLYAIKHRSVLALLRLAYSALRGRLAADPSVLVLRGRDVRIDGPGTALRVLVDGEERLFPAPVRIQIRPRALNVMAPAS